MTAFLVATIAAAAVVHPLVEVPVSAGLHKLSLIARSGRRLIAASTIK
jgi:hypothetical protein